MTALLTGLLGIFIGALIGHRAALGRDKRKEHNEIVLPLKQKLLSHIDRLAESDTSGYIEDRDISALRVLISEIRYKKVKKLFDEYYDLLQLHMKISEIGMIYYEPDDCVLIASKARKINKRLRLK